MLKFGWGKRCISMDGPVQMIGQPHLRISRGVYDESFVTALVIDNGQAVSILVSADLIFADDGIATDVRTYLKNNFPSIPSEKLLLSATHTHTSPRYEKHADYDGAPMNGISFIPPEQYRAYLVSQTANAVAEAYLTRSEGAFSYGYGNAVVGYHRRPTYTADLRSLEDTKGIPAFAVNKHARMYGRTADPLFDGYEGGADSTVNLLFTFDAEERLTGAVINVSCPSQCSEQAELLSADYWADVRARLQKTYGDIYVLPQCAAAGDLSPRALHGFSAEGRKNALKYGTDEKTEIGNRCLREEIAERICSAFDECFAWATKEKIRDAVLLHSVRRIKLERWKISSEEYRAAERELAYYKAQPLAASGDALADFKKNTKLFWLMGRCESILSRYEQNEDDREVELHTIRLGEVAFASNPFELYLSYQHRIQARSPFVQSFIVQLAADEHINDYLPTKRASENMGYGAVIQSCTVSPSGGDTLVKETLKALEALYSTQKEDTLGRIRYPIRFSTTACRWIFPSFLKRSVLRESTAF